MCWGTWSCAHFARARFQFKLLTGARPGEVLGLCWDDIVAKWHRLTLPPRLLLLTQLALQDFVLALQFTQGRLGMLESGAVALQNGSRPALGWCSKTLFAAPGMQVFFRHRAGVWFSASYAGRGPKIELANQSAAEPQILTQWVSRRFALVLSVCACSCLLEVCIELFLFMRPDMSSGTLTPG